MREFSTASTEVFKWDPCVLSLPEILTAARMEGLQIACGICTDSSVVRRYSLVGAGTYHALRVQVQTSGSILPPLLKASPALSSQHAM